jgi:hypothetical protein
METNSTSELYISFRQIEHTHSLAGQQIFCPVVPNILYLIPLDVHVRKIFSPYYPEKTNLEFDLAPGFYHIDETQSFIFIAQIP